jgi:hypothetical protein
MIGETKRIDDNHLPSNYYISTENLAIFNGMRLLRVEAATSID